VVGEREELYRQGAELCGLNLIAIPALEQEMEVTVKIRYTAPEVPATISPSPRRGGRACFSPVPGGGGPGAGGGLIPG